MHLGKSADWVKSADKHDLELAQSCHENIAAPSRNYFGLDTFLGPIPHVEETGVKSASNRRASERTQVAGLLGCGQQETTTRSRTSQWLFFAALMFCRSLVAPEE